MPITATPKAVIPPALRGVQELSRYFRISSRSHHGLVFVTELAKAAVANQPMSIRTISKKMHISEGYLEELVACLRRAGIVRGARGRGGGYTLAQPANQVSMGAIVRLLDGPVVFAHCQDPTASGTCPAEAHCTSRHFFGRLKVAIDRELDATTLADFVLPNG